MCRAWLESNGDEPPPADLEPWASSAWGTGSKARRIDLTDCEEIGVAIDEHCGFDSGAVKEFTESTLANGGDYTIGLWVRPVVLPDPTASLHPNGNFHPSIQFLSSISPPKPLLGLSLWANPQGEVRWYTTCKNSSSRDPYENIQTFAAKKDGWTFIAISRINSTWPSSTSTKTITDVSSFEEDTIAVQCLHNEEHMFQGLEINYPMLIGPIMLVPQALSLQAMQRIYHSNVLGMKARLGPLRTAANRDANSRIPVYKLDFGLRSVMMAPPLIAQERVKKTTQCPFEYASRWIQEQHDSVTNSLCAEPNQCVDARVVASPELTMSCARHYGYGEDRQDHFGLATRMVQGREVVADLLYRCFRRLALD